MFADLHYLAIAFRMLFLLDSLTSLILQYKQVKLSLQELKQVLAESRLALNSLCQATLGAAAAQESLERPFLRGKLQFPSTLICVEHVFGPESVRTISIGSHEGERDALSHSRCITFRVASAC
jgi:hypothetical protein